MNTSSEKTGVLLMNLGTPVGPDPKSVGAYLREFLMDPLVVDIAYPLRWILVNALIVPRRSHASSLLYKKIWRADGSPLLIYLRSLAEKTQSALGENFLVVPAMRYSQPTISAAAAALKSAGVNRVLCFPLYPQYSLAATQSSIEAVRRELETVLPNVPLYFVPPFYDRGEYLDSVAAVSAPHLKDFDYDKVLFSFHGLPERQVKKTDPTSSHCLASVDCCARIVDANRNCYRAQSYYTARELARRLGIAENKYEVCFQSRLGRTPWIKPYTDEFYRELPKQGVRRLAVLCPSFVADCLENLEEVAIRGKEEFLSCGGNDFRLVPSLNDNPVWIEAVTRLIRSEVHHPNT